MGSVITPGVLTYDPRFELSTRSNAATLLLLCAVCAVADPGLLAGAIATWCLWSRVDEPQRSRWVYALMSAVCLLVFSDAVLWAWPWRVLFGSQLAAVLPALGPPPTGHQFLPGIGVEALGGPLLLQVSTAARSLLGRTITSQLSFQRRNAEQRQQSLAGESSAAKRGVSSQHPPGLIRLGIDSESRRPFDLHPSELAEHVFLPGASGSGKTTTLSRLTDGVLNLGAGVVILDCKGGDLKDVARVLALRYDLPFYLVDSDDRDSLGYDPCSGDAADVSNKLVGVFNFSGAAEIYKLAAMRALPLLVNALQAAGDQVTLATLQDALDGGLGQLGRRAGDPYRDQLGRLEDAKGVVAEGHLGLALRFGALLAGRFGPLFRAGAEGRAVLDWDRALAEPSVTYIALRATASSEDVELMGRIIAQDLKQVCARRFQSLARGEQLVSALLVIDEFAALREAEQFVDLLLQARQALMPTVLSTQYIPELVKIRKAALEAGLIICHRVESEDAEAVAAQFGTSKRWDHTIQTGEEGATGMGSARRVDEYNVHPNELRDMRRGMAAVRSVPGQRRAIVQVSRVDT